MNNYDTEIEAICHAARFKMLCNKHKGNIEDLSAGEAIELAKKELDEMHLAITNDDYEGVVLEAGDVMNFLISVVYNSMDKYRRRPK